MGYGLSIINTSGFPVIDQDYANHRLLQSGVAIITNAYSSDWINFPSQTDGVVIAVGGDLPSDAYVGLRTLESNRFRLYGERYVNYSTTFSVSYRVYAKSSNNSPSLETYGLRVYKSDSSLVFDSGHDSLVVKGVVSYFVDGSGSGYPYADQGVAVKFTIPRLGSYVSINETLPICGRIAEPDYPVSQPTFVYGLRSTSIQVGIGYSIDVAHPPMGDGNYINMYADTNRLMLLIG